MELNSQPISMSAKDIFIRQMKQYFDNEPHINATRLLHFKTCLM